MKQAIMNKILREALADLDLPDFTVKKELLFHSNINELLRGFTLDDSNFDKNKITLHVFIQPLYLLNSSLILNFGFRLRSTDGDEWLDFGEKNYEKSKKELIKMIQKGNYEFLEKIQNARDFYDFYKGETATLRKMEAWVYTSVYIDDEKAKENLLELIEQIKKMDKSYDWMDELLNTTEFLYKTFVKTPEKVDEIFNSWYDQTVTNLNLN